jgi:hypothetical protein
MGKALCYKPRSQNLKAATTKAWNLILSEISVIALPINRNNMEKM